MFLIPIHYGFPKCWTKLSTKIETNIYQHLIIAHPIHFFQYWFALGNENKKSDKEIRSKIWKSFSILIIYYKYRVYHSQQFYLTVPMELSDIFAFSTKYEYLIKYDLYCKYSCSHKILKVFAILPSWQFNVTYFIYVSMDQWHCLNFGSLCHGLIYDYIRYPR